MSYKIWKNKQEIERFKFLYAYGLSVEKLCKIFNKSVDQIYRTAKYEKVTRQIQSVVNPNYFEKIDSTDKAYFLGLLYADGNNCQKDNRYVIGLSLQKEDKHILDLYKITLKVKNKMEYLKRVDENHKDKYKVSFKCEKMSKDLYNLGCIPNKSLILKFPTEEQVPSHLIHHFIRGYFDGDGHIGINKLGKSVFNVVGTYEFLEKLQEYLIAHCFLNKTKLSLNKRKGKTPKNTYQLTYNGKFSARKIRKYLYKNCENFYIKRKKEKFDKI